jgi:hypothetical protein
VSSIGEKRLRFCRSKVNWSLENDWDKIIISDQAKEEIGADKKMYVWKKGRLKPESKGRLIIKKITLLLKLAVASFKVDWRLLRTIRKMNGSTLTVLVLFQIKTET